MRVLIAGYQHETNTFAPTRADWAAFTRGDSFPPFMRGDEMRTRLSGVNIPIGGFMDAARSRGWQLLPSAWAGAIPSAHVTQEAFERIALEILTDVKRGGFDAVYLDLHGAAVAEHVDDTEGELLARIRSVVGRDIPIVASLDLHANVTQRMLAESDGLVAYREYPHTDMAATGERAAELLARRVRGGQKLPTAMHRIPFLIPINAQCTRLEPARGVYDRLALLEEASGVMLSFAPGFPAADFAECGPLVWGHGAGAPEAVTRLAREIEALRPKWASEILDPVQAVQRAMGIAHRASRPVVIADTQDNPGAGADSNTTGMLHALSQQEAGRRFPGRVALGLLYDPAAAQAAHAVGVGGGFDAALGLAVPTFTGALSDAPLVGRATVSHLSDGRVTLTGPMMKGLTVALGPCARVAIDGIEVLITSGKKQLLDRELYRFLGIEPETMKILVNKSSVHFRADFDGIAEEILVAKAAGPMAADPADLPWTKLPAEMARRP